MDLLMFFTVFGCGWITGYLSFKLIAWIKMKEEAYEETRHK